MLRFRWNAPLPPAKMMEATVSADNVRYDTEQTSTLSLLAKLDCQCSEARHGYENRQSIRAYHEDAMA